MTFTQTILVTKSGNHLDVIRAAALASARALQAFEGPAHYWRFWLDDSFTKVVKQTSRAKIERALELLPEGRTASSGEALAAAFPPVPKEALYARGGPLGGHLGIDRAKPEDITNYQHPSGPTLVLNADLGMSTGKAAAQGAHAFMMVALADESAPLSLDTVEVAWRDADAFEAHSRRDRVHAKVVDNGLTEVPPGTVTALLVSTL